MTLNEEQTKLKLWMEDYALHKQLEIQAAETGGAGEAPDFSEEPAPAEGQIRLWPAVEMFFPPMYGLLMRAGYGRWRVFPFSELATPATPGELLVREDPPVRVLQGWNARSLPQAKVAQSWFVDVVPAEKLFQVNLWWLCLEGGSEPGGDLCRRCGPRLRHPQDPRHEYLDLEANRADVCLGEAPAVYQVDRDLKQAAEPEEGYGKGSGPDLGD
ncbi:hypothetical protein P0Y35_11560 [Kiritimatiellaeota bacterium B1221]|nr:hypothetical protein [Kiritimatiellaeota bacterium B1221]